MPPGFLDESPRNLLPAPASKRGYRIAKTGTVVSMALTIGGKDAAVFSVKSIERAVQLGTAWELSL